MEDFRLSEKLVPVEFQDIQRDGDYWTALEKEVIKLRRDKELLDKLDEHRIAASHEENGEEVLDYYYWEVRCQCYDIRNAIESGDING